LIIRGSISDASGTRLRISGRYASPIFALFVRLFPPLIGAAERAPLDRDGALVREGQQPALARQADAWLLFTTHDARRGSGRLAARLRGDDRAAEAEGAGRAVMNFR
jgi:hypothetical protein